MSKIAMGNMVFKFFFYFIDRITAMGSLFLSAEQDEIHKKNLHLSATVQMPDLAIPSQPIILDIQFISQ